MAANLQRGRAVVAGIGRRVARIGTGGSRRGVQSSAYDKNPDEPVQASAVPDDVLEPKSDKYWEPNPKTGVFGPADQNGEVGIARGSSPGNDNTVLDQGAWFRPLEDVQKPPPA